MVVTLAFEPYPHAHAVAQVGLAVEVGLEVEAQLVFSGLQRIGEPEPTVGIGCTAQGWTARRCELDAIADP